jgi:hypothetical protein
MPWTPKPISQLERQIETLQIKLLRANSELRLKTVYAQRLEFLLQPPSMNWSPSSTKPERRTNGWRPRPITWPH